MINEMKLFLVLSILALFFFGCAGLPKETKIKCPRWGTVFTVDEGLAEIQKKGS